MERTPLYVIAGSLGSGKTTLLRRLLSGDYGKLAVMINEFGEIGIDGELVEGRNVDMMELTGGCVCCSLSGEFEAGVRELIEKAAPEAILVETTGVAEADALVEDIQDDLEDVRLEAVVVLVDADTANRFPEFGYVERNQIAFADLVLLNKTDLVEQAEIDELRQRLEAINPDVRVIETERARVDPELVLARGGERSRPPGRSADRGQSDHGMESFAWRPSGSLERRCLEQAMEAWPRAVYRAKGRLTVDGVPMILNYVAGRYQLEPGDENEPALVWIGPGVQRHRDKVIASLEACVE